MVNRGSVRSTVWRELYLGAALLVIFGCSQRAEQAPPGANDSARLVAEEERPAVAANTPDIERGPALYAQHCAACHGDKGDGQGPAARFLYPKPRDFRAGRFRLVSTTNGVPTADDVMAVLERGMPGSAMIPWAHLDKTDRDLLVQEVLRLRRSGARAVEVALAAEAEEERTEAEFDEAAALATVAGEVFAVPRLSAMTSEGIARGRELYVAKGCAACHGAQGKGDGQQSMVDAEGRATRPRDLTLGIFKGNSDPQSIYRRLWLGMPGSPMPASQSLTPEQVDDMVHFVLSLSDETARQRVVLRRQQIVAKRVAQVPRDADDPQWGSLPIVRLGTTPLWWRDESDPALEVRAAHDGALLSVRLEWNDASADERASRSEDFEDAVAVELFRGTAEPFVGMGSSKLPVEVWMWDADRQRGPRDVEETNPNIVVDQYPFAEGVVESAEFARRGTDTGSQPAISFPARLAGNPIMPSGDGSAVTTLEAGGQGTLTFRPPRNQSVVGNGRWKEGRWTVVMQRPLQIADDSAALELRPQDKLSLACALWDGSRKDRDGQKRITIWNDLELESP